MEMKEEGRRKTRRRGINERERKMREGRENKEGKEGRKGDEGEMRIIRMSKRHEGKKI